LSILGPFSVTVTTGDEESGAPLSVQEKVREEAGVSESLLPDASSVTEE
jgi:hypothetical protein